ncbi:MAG: hypothetical protein E7267_07420 [Lachnospiraceae bacterium]|nr:hypothetical protein [Lachnospiraceae bacterium]
MILKLLEIKEHIKSIYERFGIFINMFLKFIISLFVFYTINNKLGFSNITDNMIIIVGLSVISALTPNVVFLLLTVLVLLVNAYSLSILLAAVMAVLFLLIYLLFIRYNTGQAYIILAVPILYTINIPYVVPLLCGLFFGPVAAIANVIGILLYYFFSSIIAASEVSDGTSIANTVNFFNTIVDDLKDDKYMVVSMIIFSCVVLITYIIRKQKLKHASYIAILIGTLITIVTFLIASVTAERNVIGIVVGSLISALIACIAQFFRMSLDYAGTKNIQFEDDEYYYYVKAVPKLTIAEPEKQVKTIHAQKPTGNTTDISEILAKSISEDDFSE